MRSHGRLAEATSPFTRARTIGGLLRTRRSRFLGAAHGLYGTFDRQFNADLLDFLAT
jgi:hypothetical protein